MNSKHSNSAWKCSKVLTFPAAAILACTVATAQTGTNSPQPTNGGSNGSMNGASNGGMNGGSNGSMNGGSNGSMNGGMNGNSGTMNGANSAQAGNSSSMGSMPMGGSNGAMASAQDKKFAKAAMAGGLTEIQAAQTALQKSQSDDVKKFAQQMIDDHTKLNDQMKPIAAQIGVPVPTEPMPKDQGMLAKMQALSGDTFDKAYLKAMVKDHLKDDKEFSTEASSGQNPQEKDAASQGDQIVKQHLQMAQALAKAHNAMGGSKSSI